MRAYAICRFEHIANVDTFLNGRTPLMVASEYAHLHTVNALIEARTAFACVIPVYSMAYCSGSMERKKKASDGPRSRRRGKDEAGTAAKRRP
jgi:ankyrin repeat protein